jgi:hypothetical protein
MTLSIDNAVKSLNPATGDLTSIENGTTFVAPVSGNSASGTGPAPAGACIGWSTGDVVNGHPVRGRTFLVPLAAGMYEGNGTLTTGALIDINDAVVSLVNATASFEIWHRPVSGLGGSEHVVTAGAAKDKVAVLRSRRD